MPTRNGAVRVRPRRSGAIRRDESSPLQGKPVRRQDVDAGAKLAPQRKSEDLYYRSFFAAYGMCSGERFPGCARQGQVCPAGALPLISDPEIGAFCFSGQYGAVDKVTFILVLTNKKDAHRRHPACFIIRFRFNAVADKRQWSSAASKPRRKTRAKLCSRFCAENEPSHQTCRSFSASR